MLKLFWTPAAFVGAPDAAGYADAADTLQSGLGAGSLLQSFRRGDDFTFQPAGPLTQKIAGWTTARGTGRVVVMVHGYEYDPSLVDDDPFNLVYGIQQPAGNTKPPNSWLPFVGETDEAGVAQKDMSVAFAWVSEGSFSRYADAGWNSSYQYAAFDLAPLAARALATVIGALLAAGLTVDILAHSLGTRTTSQAIGLLRRAKVSLAGIRRAVLLGGAEYCVDANANLLGAGFEVFNICSRIDDVLKIGAEEFGDPVRPNNSPTARVIGREGLKIDDAWLDIQLDRADVAGWLRAEGYPNMAAAALNTVHPMSWLNHWAYYMNDGNRAFLKDLLSDAPPPIAWFRDNQCPPGVAVDFYGQVTAAVPPTPQKFDQRPGPQPPPQQGGRGGGGWRR